MRHAHLDRRGQVDDGLVVGRRLPDIEHGVADLERILRLRAREALWRILETVIRARLFRELFEELRAIDGHLLDFLFRLAENLLALRDRRRIVDMDDGILDAFQRLERLADDVLARLRQHLHRHVIRNQVVLDEAAQEFILRVRSCGESDLDFLEPDLQEHLVKLELLVETHRDDERLVAVAHIDAAPDGCMIRRILLHPLRIDCRRHEITLAVLLIILHSSFPPN